MNDLLMWIGHGSYNTIEEFVSESREDEIYKRIGKIPKDLALGKTKVFLAHDEGEEGNAVIFGYFTVDHVEILFYKKNMKQVEDTYAGCPVVVKSIEDVLLSEKQTGRGYRDEEKSIYLCGKPYSLVPFTDFRDYNKLIDSTGKRFRSYKRINGDDIFLSKDFKPAPSLSREKVPQISVASPESDWSKSELLSLIRLVEEYGKPIKAFKEMSYRTNRSMRAIEFQWYSKVKKALPALKAELEALETPVPAEEPEPVPEKAEEVSKPVKPVKEKKPVKKPTGGKKNENSKSVSKKDESKS